MCRARSGQPSPCTDSTNNRARPQAWPAQSLPLFKPEVLLRKVPQVQIRLKATLRLIPGRDEPRKRTRKLISLDKEGQGHLKDKTIQKIKCRNTLQNTNYVYVIMAVQGYRIQSTSYRRQWQKNHWNRLDCLTRDFRLLFRLRKS